MLSFPLLTIGDGIAQASVPDKFDLSDAAEPLFTSKALTDNTVQQSFAFDNTNNCIYVVKVTAGGQQLGTETRTYTAAERALNGDLTVTKLSTTGTVLGNMYLMGFGHGLSIGAEPVGTTTYLWTEVDAVNDGSDGNGYGTQLARFPFVNNQVLVNTDSSITKYTPVVGANAGSSLLFSEPEGMSIQVVGTTVRLCFGFGSYRSSTDTKKNANIFYKDALVTGT